MSHLSDSILDSCWEYFVCGISTPSTESRWSFGDSGERSRIDIGVVMSPDGDDPSSFWPVFGLDWPVLGLNWLFWPLAASVVGVAVVEAAAVFAGVTNLGTFVATLGECFGASFGEFLLVVVWGWPPTPEAPPPPPPRPDVGPVSSAALRLLGGERRGPVNPCTRSSTSVVMSSSSSGRIRFFRRSLTSNATSLMSEAIGRLKSHSQKTNCIKLMRNYIHQYNLLYMYTYLANCISKLTTEKGKSLLGHLKIKHHYRIRALLAS
jgi:hypothetical protein